MTRARSTALALTVLASLSFAPTSAAAPFSFSYGGRIADDQDRGIVGPVTLELRFWTAPSGGSDLLGRPLSFASVSLDDGAFAVDAGGSQFAPADMQKAFGASGDTWVEVRDVTHNVTYPRQRLSAVPYALKVPVDSRTITYDQSGNLTLVAGAPAAGQVLTTDASGNIAWGQAPTSGGSVSSVIAGSGLQISGGNAAITTTGTLNVNTGSGPNQIVQIGSDGKLPALDGSRLTGIAATNYTGVLAVANGGTGATTASAARTGLGAAGSGANGDITSLTGLTTPLSLTAGGTGATNALAARTALALGSAATLTAGTLANNAVQLDGTGKLPAIDGSNLTHLSSGNILGIIGVGSGGTGAASLSPGGALVMNSGGTAVTSVMPTTAGNVLTSNGTSWVSQPGMAGPWLPGGGNIYVPTGSVGIGTSAPATLLHVAGVPGGGQPVALFETTSGGSPPEVHLRKSNSVLTTMQPMGRYGFEGFDGSGIGFAAYIEAEAGSPWTTGSHESGFTFFVTPPGSASAPAPSMHISGSGLVGIGIGTATPSNMLQIGPNNGYTGNQFVLGVGAASVVLQPASGYTTLSSNQPLVLQATGSSSGNVGIGTTAPSATLHILGSLCVKSVAGTCAGSTAGTIYATTTSISSADLAEHMPVEDASLIAGDVVAVQRSSSTGAGVFVKTTQAYDRGAVGVVSTSPGVALGSDTKSSQPIALAGRVPANVTLEGGSINVGDYLVGSSTEGKAMRAVDPRRGGIIGIALSAYNGTAVPARTYDDGIAHEAGHQVMMLVQAGASQGAIEALQADSVKKDAEIALLKTYICSKDPDAPFCGR